MTRPHTRTGDPATSFEAAESVGDMRVNLQAVLAALAGRGEPMSDEQLLEVYADGVAEGFLPPQSESGIRSRRAELVELGLVIQAGCGTNSGGRRVNVWMSHPHL